MGSSILEHTWPAEWQQSVFLEHPQAKGHIFNTYIVLILQ